MINDQEHNENGLASQEVGAESTEKKSSEKNTKTHNIFLIDKSKLNMSNSSVEDALGLLMSEDEEYKLQKLKTGVNTGPFSVRLYFRGDDNYQSQFSSFCKSFVEEDQKAVTFYPRSASSVLFIWNDKHIYAVTTGQGYRMVEDYSVPKFGLILASCFNEEFKVTSLDSNAMASVVHSSKTIYSKEVDFVDVNALDTIFKEVTGRLKDKKKVQKFLGLKGSSKRDTVKVSAKNSVQFSSALSFAGLLHLLEEIDKLGFDGQQEHFNLIAPLSAKKHKAAITANNNAVIEAMYTAIQSGKEIPFDLFHKNTTSYIEAEWYEIYDPSTGMVYATFDDHAATGAVLAAYKAFLSGRNDTPATFYFFAISAMLRSFTGDGSPSTDDSLLKHISGEIQVSGKNYYIFYGEYYYLNKAYTDRLNKSLKGKLRKEFYTKEMRTAWIVGENEDWFNETASTSERYVHLHKVLPDNIEFADLLKYENGTITVVHVKDGFNCDMRALDRQVELSVTKIIDIKHNNNESYFRNLYQEASVHTVGLNIAAVFPTVDEFLDCMKNNPVRYIIAIRPAKKNLLDNESNIAKHCLNALILRCFQQGIELRIQVL